MFWRKLLLAVVALGVSTAVFICALAIGPVVPAFTHSVEFHSSLDKGVGVLILAPNGGDEWRSMVKTAVKDVKDRYPLEIAFGDADPISIHVATEKLKMQGVEKIAMVPLFISSHSPVFHQIRYILGLAGEPDSSAGFAHPIPIDVPFVLGDAMDANPVVADVLVDRARAVSRKPSNETLVIVADGAGDVYDDAYLHKDMEALAGMVKAKAGFKSVLPVAIPSESPFPIQSADKLRDTVKAQSAKGRVIVIPLMFDETMLQTRIDGHLKGLNYILNNKCLLPHDKIRQWVQENIQKQLIRLNLERFAGDDVMLTT
jgi:sirohydrochlorin ferrochelatase